MADHQYIKSLPKVELHAHLHGSIRDETIEDLISSSKSSYSTVKTAIQFAKGNRSLEECFQVFALLHDLVTTQDIVRRITREVIMDFATDNVKYLELRTTPRRLTDASKEQYVCIVLEEMNACAREMGMCVRLILSIDRSQSIEEAADTLRLAHRYQSLGVVGLDFSGNPYKRCFQDFAHIFDRARRVYGLHTTVHTAELPDAPDTDYIINHFRPDRLGHAVRLNDQQWQQVHQQRIAIEMCPSSNMKTCAFDSLKQHPYGGWRHTTHPVAVCTDDSGVFNTTLSKELQSVVDAFQLRAHDVDDMMRASVDMIFDTPQQRVELNRMLAYTTSRL